MDETTVTVSIRLPQDLKKGLEEVCEKADLTLSQLFRMWARGIVKEAKALPAMTEPLPEKQPIKGEIKTVNREQRRKLAKSKRGG